MDEFNPIQQFCGAKTRKGTLCKNPPVIGKKRCRMHGGAKGSGAPKGNSNALRHGLYSKKVREQQSEIYKLLNSLNELTDQLQ